MQGLPSFLYPTPNRREFRIEFDGKDVSGPIQLTTTTQRCYLFI